MDLQGLLALAFLPSFLLRKEGGKNFDFVTRKRDLCERSKTAAAPPAYAHAKRELAALKGRLGSRGYFCESNQSGTLGRLDFSGKV